MRDSNVFRKKAAELKAENEKLRMELERINQLFEETLVHTGKMENAVEDRERRIKSFSDQLEEANNKLAYTEKQLRSCLNELQEIREQHPPDPKEEKKAADLAKQWEALFSWTGVKRKMNDFENVWLPEVDEQEAITKIWDQYTEARRYNEAIDLYKKVQRCEDHFVGKQWEGVNAPDLDKLVINLGTRVVSFFVSNIVSDDIGIHMNSFDDDEEELIQVGMGNDVYQATRKSLLDMLDKQLAQVMELTECKRKLRKFIEKAAVDADGCLHSFWNPESRTGILNKDNSTPGNIEVEQIYNYRVLFGNQQEPDVELQPWIILEYRYTLEEAKYKAKQNGIENWDAIQPDNGEGGVNDKEENGKVTVLRRYWRDRKTKTIWAADACKQCYILKPVDMGLSLYPVVWMPWREVMNSYHGVSAIEQILPNQIAVNKLYSMGMHSIKNTAFPKTIYDRTKLPGGWSNRVGEAIGVNGNPKEAVSDSYRSADMSNQVFTMLDKLVNMTRDTMGASDAALGNINPKNTSAIIAVQKATSMPLELNKFAFYDAVERLVRIWLDMMGTYYKVRTVRMEVQPEIMPPEVDPLTGIQMPAPEPEPESVKLPFDFSQIKGMDLKLNVDIGGASYWSEMVAISIMDNLFMNHIIDDPEVYLKGLPNGVVPNEGEVLKHVQERKEQAAAIAAPQMNGLPDGMGGLENAVAAEMGGMM